MVFEPFVLFPPCRRLGVGGIERMVLILFEMSLRKGTTVHCNLRKGSLLIVYTLEIIELWEKRIPFITVGSLLLARLSLACDSIEERSANGMHLWNWEIVSTLSVKTTRTPQMYF